ncbi:hypothetical protein GSU68_15015 [Rathayibacter sp. VKM Ac-2759]|uniref:hypothetical protein n=1 Tax=Rathayibacter sp. VKM Ac-2759 TaxID=2609252 RepID=UPI00131620EB|nr:hypothetical protein [Rathayibacter sp. VKM Ac-2759]QHC67746.1 hypothetical protein GSU68_15015 [Rathayibacter sp. VKM Ac-2759]
MSRLRAGIVLAAALVLSGCSASDPAIDDSTAQTLDDAVVAVAERASADDYAGALTQLDALQAALDAALAADGVTADRAAAIQIEVDTVRADLAALVAEAPAPVETPSEDPSPEEETPVEETPVEEAPAEETPVEEEPEEESPAPVETPEEPEPSPEEPAPVEEEPAPAETAPAAVSPGNSGTSNGNNGNGNSGNGNGNGNNGNGNGNGGGRG